MNVPSSKENIRILVIDRDPDSKTILSELIQNMDFEVRVEEDVRRAIRELEIQEFAVVITDNMLNGYSGLDVMHRAKSRHPLTEVIIVTGQATLESAMAALAQGAHSFVEKPISFSAMQIHIRQALAKRSFAVKAHRLLEESTTLTPTSQRYIDDLLNLFRLSRRLMTSVDYEQIIDATLRGLEGLVPAEFYILFLVNEKEAQLHVRSGKAGFETFLSKMKQSLLASWKNLSDMTTTPDTIKMYFNTASGENDSQMSDTAIESILCVPLVAQTKVMGLLSTASTHPSAFDTETYQLLNVVADYVAIIMNNASRHHHAQFLASTDGLTGLFNYRTLHERLKHELDRSRRYGSSLSLIMLDIDLFKKVNDAYGHVHGDTVLREVADILRASTREVDLLARYGGDEFVVILPETKPKNGVLLAERIRNAVKKRNFRAANSIINITISLGVATYPHPEVSTKEDLINRADRALYDAKNSGLDKVVLAK